jgi:hypothetical protein
MNFLSNLWTARVLVLIGLIAGYYPVSSTFTHIGSERHLLINSSTHGWHHFFREGMGDVAATVAILVIIFAAPRFRNPMLWWVMIIIMIGFYAPFWIGVPFMAELAAPSMTAEIAHLSMAVPALLGGLLARRHFFDQPAA